MEVNRFSPRVLVAQIGARRRYAVPRALHHLGCLESLVTDACSSVAPWAQAAGIVPEALRPRFLRTVLDREVEGVDYARIQGCLSVFLGSRVGRLRPRAGEPKVSYWIRQNEAFGRAVNSLNWGRAECVYAFNGAALEVFERARSEGRRCVLDQTAAPWRFNSELLEREAEKWPHWEDRPADCDRDGRMIAREETEWELADRIVCGSEFVLDAIRQVGGPDHKCVVVPYPTPSAPQSRAEGRVTKRRLRRVLFAGTLQLRKGIQYVCETARRMTDDGFEFRAVGPSSLTTWAEQEVRSRMDWRGTVARSDIWQHYLWADTLLLPTLSEGSANVCWEAIACGTSVITTTAAGLKAPYFRGVEPDTDQIEAMLRSDNAAHRLNETRILTARSVAEYGADLLRAVS